MLTVQNSTPCAINDQRIFVSIEIARSRFPSYSATRSRASDAFKRALARSSTHLKSTRDHPVHRVATATTASKHLNLRVRARDDALASSLRRRRTRSSAHPSRSSASSFSSDVFVTLHARIGRRRARHSHRRVHHRHRRAIDATSSAASRASGRRNARRARDDARAVPLVTLETP